MKVLKDQFAHRSKAVKIVCASECHKCKSAAKACITSVYLPQAKYKNK